MADRGNSRIVYSTGTGRICDGCGWPEHNCTCSSRIGPEQSLPTRIVAKLRVENKGRGGKTVTLVYGLPRNTTFIKELTQELKRACGTGGTAVEDGVELQGDLRDRVRDVLQKKGFLVKG